MEQLKAVIAHLLRLVGSRGVNRTVLTKLVYFSELEYWRRCGEPLTGVQFQKYTFGAWAPAVVDITESLPYVEHKTHWSPYTSNSYRLVEGAPLPPLDDEVIDILASVFREYGTLSASKIGKLSKQTEPMLRASEQGELLDLSVVAEAPPLKVRSSRLAQAQASLDLSQRGTREELDRRDAVEMEMWAAARRRAAAV